MADMENKYMQLTKEMYACKEEQKYLLEDKISL